MEQLESIRDDAEYYISRKWKDMNKMFKVGKYIWIDPAQGKIFPERAIIQKVLNQTLETDKGIIQKSWVLYIEKAKFKKMELTTFEVYKRLQQKIQTIMKVNTDVGNYSKEDYQTAHSILYVKRFTAQLKSNLSPETSGLWDEYKRQLAVLQKHGFIDSEEIPTIKGKMAAGVLCTEDPLTLVEFITQAEYSEEELIPILTCFLRKKKNDDPSGSKIFQNIVRIQKNIWTLKNHSLGTTMIHPMQMWMNGHSVTDIVNSCDISVGHFCKEALRMKELLSQLVDVCHIIGNTRLEELFMKQNKKLQRGLPFLPSSMIK